VFTRSDFEDESNDKSSFSRATSIRQGSIREKVNDDMEDRDFDCEDMQSLDDVSIQGPFIMLPKVEYLKPPSEKDSL